MQTYTSRYGYGVNVIKHKGKSTTTSINTDFFDNIDLRTAGQPAMVGTVKEYIKHRPDTISDIFYDNATYWWYLLLYNNMNDPFNSLNPTDTFLVPLIDEELL